MNFDCIEKRQQWFKYVQMILPQTKVRKDSHCTNTEELKRMMHLQNFHRVNLPWSRLWCPTKWGKSFPCVKTAHDSSMLDTNPALIDSCSIHVIQFERMGSQQKATHQARQVPAVRQNTSLEAVCKEKPIPSSSHPRVLHRSRYCQLRSHFLAFFMLSPLQGPYCTSCPEVWKELFFNHALQQIPGLTSTSMCELKKVGISEQRTNYLLVKKERKPTNMLVMMIAHDLSIPRSILDGNCWYNG